MNKTILSAILIISLLMTGCAVEDKSCSDDVKNQDETDIDCGGSCDPCADGKACETDDDCVNKCSSNDKCYTPVKKTTTTTTTRKAEAEGAELSEETISRVENKLKPTLMSAFAISENFRSMEVGDEHTFGLGLTNVYVPSYYFKVSITLDKAVDKYSNTLQKLDEAYINEWLDKNEFVFELTQNENKIWPLKVKVGDEMSDGAPTKPGSYTYNIRVTYGDDASLIESIKERYISKQTLTIRVK